MLGSRTLQFVSRRGVLVGTLMLACVATASAQWSPEDLAYWQQRAAEENWPFQIVDNPAIHRPLDQLCGARPPADWEARVAAAPPMPVVMNLPEQFDWRDPPAGYPIGVTPIRDQGGCGACWAFGTVGALESAIKIQDGNTVDLSEQWLVNCVVEFSGCNGGWFAHDYFTTIKSDACGGTGAVLEADLPYVAWNAPCNCPYPHYYSAQTWGIVSPGGNVDAIKSAIYQYGPVTVSISATGPFGGYGGGVLDYHDPGADINHMVVLVGWDDAYEHNNETYGVWFLRNSWGTDWGENGYMNITYGSLKVGQAAAYIDYAPTTDCNLNGIPDNQDLINETSSDCDENGIPDECDITNCAGDPACGDCNVNGVPDECDLAYGQIELFDDTAWLGWQEIATTGTPLNLADDGHATITSPFTNALVEQANIVVHNNGGIGLLGSSNVPAANGIVPTPDVFADGKGLLPYWDDLSATSGNVYWQVQGAAPDRVLIIQWQNRPHYDGPTDDGITFQVQLYETPIDGLFGQYLYQETSFSSPSLDHGSSATVGYQRNGETGDQYAFNAYYSVSPGKVLALQASLPLEWDCNANGVPDSCDIADGTSSDDDDNGVPDECEAPPVCRGDANCDDVVNWRDIDFFVAAQGDNVAGWEALFAPGTPACSFENNDCNADGTVNWRDIDPFVAAQGTICP